MAHSFSTIPPKLAAFIRAQHLFFVATAPLSAEGLINLSPKGLDTFAILDDRTVAYLDLTGSGIETVAHLRENGRIVVMFCAFEGPPNIVRLHGQGEALEPSAPDFSALITRFPALITRFPARPGIRSIIRIHVQRASESCGFAVPLMDFRADRTTLDDSSNRKGEAGLHEYRQKKNRTSIDGLPGLSV